jgi:hypothetical protein
MGVVMKSYSLSILLTFAVIFSVNTEEISNHELAMRCRKSVKPNPCEQTTKPKLSFFLDASFLYWHVSEGGLNLATNAVWSQPSLQPFLSTDTTTLFQSFDYHPGFQVGLGIAGNNEWELCAEYTWLRGTNEIHRDAPSSPTATAGVDAVPNASGIPVWITQNWFLQSTSNNQALIGTSIQSQWKYAVDFLDVIASAPFWQKSIFTVRPLVGLKGAIIRQSLRIALTEFPSFFQPTLTAQPIFSRNRSRSIGIGPKIGVDCKIKVYDQFRIEGMGALDCLWTHFSKITHSEDAASTTFNPGPYRASTNNFNCLRTMAELGLGLGWNKSFSCEKYNLDISAAYDFVFLWNQNVMRWQLDSILTGSAAASADLMMHGLTVATRFQF